MKLQIIFATALAVAGVASAATHTITNDTYIDSFYYSTTVSGQPFVLDSTRTNYGANGAIKAVSNNGSGSQYPLTNSLVHGLFTLPSSFWTEIGSGPVEAAFVSMRVRNNSLAGRSVELHPLTHGFVAGTGGVGSNTQMGTPNTPTAPLGADWVTSDGTNNWTTAGGDFNVTSFAMHQLRVTAGNAFFDWNIAPLLNDPVTRAQIQANGLLLRTTSELSFTGNEFASLWSYDGAVASSQLANAPTVTVGFVPEPASLGGVLILGGLFLRRGGR